MCNNVHTNFVNNYANKIIINSNKYVWKWNWPKSENLKIVSCAFDALLYSWKCREVAFDMLRAKLQFFGSGFGDIANLKKYDGRSTDPSSLTTRSWGYLRKKWMTRVVLQPTKHCRLSRPDAPMRRSRSKLPRSRSVTIHVCENGARETANLDRRVGPNLSVATIYALCLAIIFNNDLVCGQVLRLVLGSAIKRLVVWQWSLRGQTIDRALMRINLVRIINTPHKNVQYVSGLCLCLLSVYWPRLLRHDQCDRLLQRNPVRSRNVHHWQAAAYICYSESV